MRRIGMLCGAALLALSWAAPASAGESPVRHEPSMEEFAHSHHVHTGNGGCVDIDAVLFVPASNGLHRGSNASSFNNPNDPDTARGPFHGTCDGKFYPGGPPAPGPHH